MAAAAQAPQPGISAEAWEAARGELAAVAAELAARQQRARRAWSDEEPALQVCLPFVRSGLHLLLLCC